MADVKALWPPKWQTKSSLSIIDQSNRVLYSRTNMADLAENDL